MLATSMSMEITNNQHTINSHLIRMCELNAVSSASGASVVAFVVGAVVVAHCWTLVKHKLNSFGRNFFRSHIVLFYYSFVIVQFSVRTTVLKWYM